MNFDAEKYIDSVKHLDMIREDKEEILRKIWNFLKFFVDNIDDLEQLSQKQTEDLEGKK